MKYHRARPGHEHPNGNPFRYCFCDRAIVQLAGIWWHLMAKAPDRKRKGVGK